MINSTTLSSILANEELLQVLANLLAQRSRFYAQIIVADLQNLASLKTTLRPSIDAKLVNQPLPEALNHNDFSKQNGNSQNNGNGNTHSNGNGNHNYIPAKAIIDPPVVSPSIPQQNKVAPKTINTEEILIDLVVQQTGYPQSSITPDLKLLDDLNLDSIKAGELIAEAAKKCGVAGEIDPSSFANSCLKDIAEIINSTMSNKLPSQPYEITAEVNSIPVIKTTETKLEKDVLSELNQLSETEIDRLLLAYQHN